MTIFYEGGIFIMPSKKKVIKPKPKFPPSNCPKLELKEESNLFFKDLAQDLESRHPEERKAYEEVIGIK
jgi:hypothetical protein